MNRRSAARRDITSFDILCLALTAPERLPRTAIDVVASDLRRRQAHEITVRALSALAALLYARPQLVGRSVVRSLARVMTGPVSDRLAAAATDAWQLLATSPIARTAARTLDELLAGRRLAPAARQALLAAMPAYARWRPDTLDLDATLRAAGAAPDDAARDAILRQVIEPLVFTSPRAFTRVMVDRTITIFSGRSRLRYTLGHLVSRAGLPDTARARAERWLRQRLPRTNAASVLGRKACRVLVIHNIADGQGDEIVRIVPPLQSLLDASPKLTATVLTRRPYLYDHARVTPSIIEDDRVIDETLAQPWDGIVDFNARTVPGVATRAELDDLVTSELASRRTSLLIRAVTQPHHFTFETVRVGVRSVAKSLGLDRIDIPNAYDATERLLMDLGLPARAGHEKPRAGSLLVGTTSREAEARWQQLRTRGHRPAALVNAFGGAHPLKGFTRDRLARLAAEISGLVDEGYAVILLPNGQPWGREDVLLATLSHIDRPRKRHVRIAPDPAAHGQFPRNATSERPDVNGADRTMRLFKYFASYADLIVTVEGWLMHLAYALGRPFRVFMAPGSADNWLPLGRGPRQNLVTSMSRLSGPDPDDLLRDDHSALQPSYARKRMLIAAARGLRGVTDVRAVALLRRIFTSPDPDLRAVAIEMMAAGELTPEVRARLRDAVHDEAAQVRAAAARALLRSLTDADARQDRGYRARLVAAVAIERQDWPTVQKLGAAALPALAASLRDPNPAIRREAHWVAALLIGQRAPARASDARPATGRVLAGSMTRAPDERRAPA